MLLTAVNGHVGMMSLYAGIFLLVHMLVMNEIMQSLAVVLKSQLRPCFFLC